MSTPVTLSGPAEIHHVYVIYYASHNDRYEILEVYQTEHIAIQRCRSELTRLIYRDLWEPIIEDI